MLNSQEEILFDAPNKSIGSFCVGAGTSKKQHGIMIFKKF